MINFLVVLCVQCIFLLCLIFSTVDVPREPMCDSSTLIDAIAELATTLEVAHAPDHSAELHCQPAPHPELDAAHPALHPPWSAADDEDAAADSR